MNDQILQFKCGKKVNGGPCLCMCSYVSSLTKVHALFKNRKAKAFRSIFPIFLLSMGRSGQYVIPYLEAQ